MKGLIKYQPFEIARHDFAVSVTNKMLSKIGNKLPDLIPYRKGNKWGFCDRNRVIKISCDYEEASLFSEGLAAVKIKGNNIYIDKDGKSVFETPYETYKDFKNGIAVVSSNYNFGIINKLGKLICECQFVYPPDFKKNRAIVKLKNKYGVIDETGKIIIDIIYDEIGFEENIFILYFDGKCGVFDLYGNMVQDFIFDWVSNCFSEGYTRIYKKDKYGFIDKNGIMVIDCIYDSLFIMGNFEDESFKNGFALVRTILTHGKNGYIDYSGKWFDKKPNKFSYGLSKIYDAQKAFCGKKIGIEERFIYDTAGELEEGFAWVILNRKVGFVDKEGDLVIDCIYDSAYSFRDGVAWVKSKGKWGFIDKSGNVIVDFIYQDYIGFSDGFSDGVCIVALNNKFGVIDKSGKIIINCIYYEINKKRTSGFFEARINAKNWKRDPQGDYLKNFRNDLLNVCRSFFDISGKVIIDDYFGFIKDFEDGLLKISKGYVDKNGNKFWED